MLRDEFLNTVNKIINSRNENEEKIRFEIIKEYILQLNENEEITADKLIKKWGLIELNTVTNEDGYFKEFIKITDQAETIAETEIFYLLKGKQVSCLHALGTTETWTWLAGKEISLFVAINQELKEIILNETNPSFTIEKDTFFGAKINNQKNDNDFGLVTCLCTPGFVPELYKNPSLGELDNLCKLYPSNEKIINELTPKLLKNNNTIMQSIIQFFTCCIGIKKIEEPEQAPLINSSRNNL